MLINQHRIIRERFPFSFLLFPFSARRCAPGRDFFEDLTHANA